MSTAQQFRELNSDDLMQKAKEAAERLFKNRFRKSLGQFEKTHEMQADRKLLARIKTVLNERSRSKA